MPDPDHVPMELFEEAHDLVQAFAELGAEYVLVGAYAFAAHGGRTADGAAEVLVRPSPENAMRVVRALAVLDVDLDQIGITHYDFAHTGTVYQLGEPSARVTLVTSISGVDFDEVWRTRVQGMIGRDSVWLVGREALARNLRAAGRVADANLLQAGRA